MSAEAAQVDKVDTFDRFFAGAAGAAEVHKRQRFRNWGMAAGRAGYVPRVVIQR